MLIEYLLWAQTLLEAGEKLMKRHKPLPSRSLASVGKTDVQILLALEEEGYRQSTVRTKEKEQLSHLSMAWLRKRSHGLSLEVDLDIPDR